MKTVTLGSKLTAIEASTFFSCDKLEKVTIGSNVKTIGECAFAGCRNLKTLSFGKSVKKIGNYAFYGNTALSSVQYSGTKSNWKAIKIGTDNAPLKTATVRYVK